MEQELGDETDNIVPTRGYHMLPVVGLGGSAGSIPALIEFFKTMPPTSGLAFVVILHLSPEHESGLPEVLQRATAMPVVAATDGMKVERNSVYVIPPRKYLTAVDGHLNLGELPSERGRRVAVDLFFRTLADTHGPHAAAVVLSGLDGDGAIGIKRIKERGGLTIAQDPAEAEFSSMPREAIATGMVDWVLRVPEIPDRLIAYHERAKRLKLPPEEGPQPAQEPTQPLSNEETALRDVLVFLRTRTGRDFSYYKRATIVRRISRRMQVNAVESLCDYLEYLRTHPGEAGALLQDLLISVTNFFRDRECFTALEAHIPALFRNKNGDGAVRVWVPACATGEEAYSIAMLLHEHARTLDRAPVIQVFATDLGDDAIQFARDALYPATIAADVSDERLQRFFVKEAAGYRIRRDVRESVLFASHDLLKDSPFSKLDLVSCRNLLIYLNREAQRRALEIFHFALNPDGLLFLGSSEGTDVGAELFAVLDKKHRIHAARGAARAILPVPVGSTTLMRALEVRERSRDRPVVPPVSVPPNTVPFHVQRADPSDFHAATWTEVHFRLIDRLGPPSILINHLHEIVHLSPKVGRFLQFAGGELSRDLIRAVNPALRSDVRAALYRAVQSEAPAETEPVPMELEGRQTHVKIRVSPAGEIAQNFMLVEIHETADEGLRPPVSAPQEFVVQHLENELERAKQHLREVVEHSEGTTEELKAGNEELQAMNEELRSATEELETSREELQSINEELTTVNHELKSKVDELAHANSDLQNLMASTAIATIFLDRELRIMRYTPPAVGIFSLIPGDVGRPLADITSRLDQPDLAVQVQRVLNTLEKHEFEVRTKTNEWFLVRILPYRSSDDRIDGVVLTLVDVTERKLAESAIRLNHERLNMALEATDAGWFVWDFEDNTIEWSETALRILDLPPNEPVSKPQELLQRLDPEDVARVKQELESSRQDRTRLDLAFRIVRRGKVRHLLARGRYEHDTDDQPARLAGLIVDVTQIKLAENVLREAATELERRVVARTDELDRANASLRREIQERKKLEGIRQDLVHRLLTAQEVERSRISRGLHDEVGQQLTGLALGLKNLAKMPPSELPKQLDDLQTMAEEIASGIHSLALELRPAALDQMGLDRTVRHHLEVWSARAGVTASLHSTNENAPRLPALVETTLYRIISEGLNNVVKHAHARNVSVIIERHANEVFAIVEDDGRGFDAAAFKSRPPEEQHQLGLAMMEERASLLGGKLEIETAPGSGTTIFARIPLSKTNNG